MRTYPAITIKQPWAAWIALGIKTVETRKHRRFTWLHGKRIAIHAGKKFDHEGYWFGRELMMQDQRDQTIFTPSFYDRLYPRGVVIALATVEAFSSAEGLESAALCDCTGLWGLRFKDVHQIGPHPARGQQGVWTWTAPEDLADAL